MTTRYELSDLQLLVALIQLKKAFRKPSSYLLVLVVLVAFWGIYQAARMGIADVVAHNAEFAVGRWDDEKRMPTADEVEKAVADARSALSWEPRNPDYHDLLAQVLI